jgi:hypothetical protein
MKGKKFYFYISIIQLFFFLKISFSAKAQVSEITDSDYLSLENIIKIGDSCSGYLFPGTCYVWTLRNCLDYDTINGKIGIQQTLISNSGDTLTFQQIRYESLNWIIIQVSVPEVIPFEEHNILPHLTDTFSIGYPVETAYFSDAITNNIDWILSPRWNYQQETFMNKIQENKYFQAVDLSIDNLKDLHSDYKNYLVDIPKSDASEYKKESLDKAITYCIQLWTNHQYARNRIATFSGLQNSASILEKKAVILNTENKHFETVSLATRLYMSLELLPNSLLPQSFIDIVLSFQKDYLQVARFLMEHPDILNQITLSIRNIQVNPMDEKPVTLPKWNQRDTILYGNGSLQIVQNIAKNQLEHKRYWKVPGMSGAPVFNNGKLIGIQKKIPFYYARELNFQNNIDFIPVEVLSILSENKENQDVWKKINGFIKK